MTDMFQNMLRQNAFKKEPASDEAIFYLEDAALEIVRRALADDPAEDMRSRRLRTSYELIGWIAGMKSGSPVGGTLAELALDRAVAKHTRAGTKPDLL